MSFIQFCAIIKCKPKCKPFKILDVNLDINLANMAKYR